MDLARNTYRFGLLVVAYAIASGIDTAGGYGVDGIAAFGFGIGALGLFGGTLAHLARGSEGQDESDGPDGEDDTGGSGSVDGDGDAGDADGEDVTPASAFSYGWS
jgi:hypothetical protein